MRVAFDARSLASAVPRGWDRYTIGLVRSLRPLGVEVTLLCRASEPVHATHRATLGCPVLPLPDRKGIWWEQVTLPLALRRHGFDLYHAPAEHGIPLFAPCPTVLTLHSATAHSYADLIRTGRLPGTLRDYLGSDADPSRRSLANNYWYAQVGRASHIIAPSEFEREEITRLLRVSQDRVTAIPLAADESFAGRPTDEGERRAVFARLGIVPPYLLYVGGFERHKNASGLLVGFAAVKRQRPDLRLVLVGSREPDPSLTAEASTLGLTLDSDVRFLSGITTDLPALYDGAELFVSLSWRESFGLPALEAMTRGTAVVASAWGAAPEVVDGGGILVDPRDHDAFARAVLALLADGARAPRARAAAARFSWASAAAQTLSVYRSLLPH